MTRHLGLRGYILLALNTLLLLGCGQPTVDLTYPTGAGDLIVEADSSGGFVPEAYVQSHIPLFRLYGDGRVVWSEWQDGRANVGEGRLSGAEIADLLDWIADKRFFAMEQHYTVENPPTDLPSDCVRVKLAQVQKTVCQYAGGAPKAFGEIFGRLVAGAGASEKRPYEPDGAWALVEPITWESAAEATLWPESLAPSLSAMGERQWVEGDLLEFLWQGRLELGPWMVYDEGDDLYGLVLQVPGLMPEAPAAP
jgi:hypothetical protein